jgi:hypothetical protein
MKKEYLIQAVFIFLSVFLGTMASNWNENYRESQRAKIFLKNLQKELKNNQEKLKKANVYHQSLKKVTDSLFVILKEKELYTPFFKSGGFQKIPHWKGLGTVAIEDDVYQSGVMSGIFENLPIETVSRISKVIIFQEEYTRFSRLISEKLLYISFDNKLIDFLLINSILGNDVARIEEQLAKSYEVLILELEKTEIE